MCNGFAGIISKRVLVLCLLVGSAIFLYNNLNPSFSRDSIAKATGEASNNNLIPNQVWQIHTTSINNRNKGKSHDEALKDTKIGATLTASWLPIDGNWTYTFLGNEAGEDFVRQHFADQPDIINVYTSLNVPVMVSDFLRYLVLAGAGGVYADSDVGMIKPLQHWVPPEYRNVTRAMIGIETDTAHDKEAEGWRFRFVQHTMITAKGHPVMMSMARNITNKLLQRVHGDWTSIAKLELHDKDVVEITGPRGFKEIVFTHLSQQIGEPIGWRNITGLKSPRLFGDTLILPINFFAAGQSHSGSDGNSPDKLAQHHWAGTWRHWNEPL
ncbi:hypothetical protein MMC09_002174 [Bachmanniomyces sp. S44760]|nr:hypothetical protein [Bachmanniomyces sp. S44760]